MGNKKTIVPYRGSGNSMNRRSFLGGSLALAASSSAAVTGLFSHFKETAPLQVASAAANDTVGIKACSVSISTAQPTTTADLVNVVRAYMKDNGLLQSFSGAEDFHAYMEKVYKYSVDADDTNEELQEAREMIVNDTACHTVDEPEIEQCVYAEAQKLYMHLEALQIYPADGSIDFNTLSLIEQYKVSNATVGFVSLINGVYPSLAEQIWPDDSIQQPVGALYARVGEQEFALVSEGVCIKPMPIEIAPAAPEQIEPQTPPKRRSTPGLVLHA